MFCSSVKKLLPERDPRGLDANRFAFLNSEFLEQICTFEQSCFWGGILVVVVVVVFFFGVVFFWLVVFLILILNYADLPRWSCEGGCT